MTLFNTCHSLGSDPQHGCANKTLKVLGDMCFAESLDASYEPKFHRQSHHDHAPVPLHKIHMPCQSSVSFLHLKFQKKIFPIDANCQDMRCTVHQDALCWFLRNNTLSCSMSRVIFFLNPTCTHVHKTSSSTSLPDLPFITDTHQTAPALF